MKTKIFSKSLRILHLDRCARAKDAPTYDYLRNHIAKDLCDRIEDLKCDSKRLVLNLGSCSGLVARNLNPDKVDTLIECDISRENVKRSRDFSSKLPLKYKIEHIQADEEFIPVKENSVDLVTSCLSLHWVNDLAKCSSQVHSVLKKDSPFVGTLFGGDTLYELRTSLELAGIERLSGVHSHISPKTTGQDVARLLQNCGYQLITVDISEIKVYYPTAFELMFDLNAMGENDKSYIGNRHMYKDVLKATAAIYKKLFCLVGEEEDGIPATFQYINFIGWKDPKRATPLKSQ